MEITWISEEAKITGKIQTQRRSAQPRPNAGISDVSQAFEEANILWLGEDITGELVLVIHNSRCDPGPCAIARTKEVYSIASQASPQGKEVQNVVPKRGIRISLAG
jgi:hypothetical protein